MKAYQFYAILAALLLINSSILLVGDKFHVFSLVAGSFFAGLSIRYAISDKADK